MFRLEFRLELRIATPNAATEVRPGDLQVQILNNFNVLANSGVSERAAQVAQPGAASVRG